MKKIIIVAAIISFAFLFSCESSTYDQVSVETSNPTYLANIKPIIDDNCVSCHSQGNQSRDFNTYALVKAGCETENSPGNGTILCRIDATCGAMMPQAGKMQSGKIKLIQLWAANGYVEQ
jgi:hypothetical protein